MIVTPFNDFEIVKKMRTCYVVRIFFDRKWKEHECFFVSVKQYNNLCASINKVTNSSVKNTYAIGVFDGDRFVWSGVEYPDFSDRDWLEKTFKAEFTNSFTISKLEVSVHIPEKIEPKETDPDATLIR